MIRRICKGYASRYNEHKERQETGERFSLRTEDKAMDYTVWWGSARSEQETHAYFLALFESKILMNEKQVSH